jgi:uncharacterized membrane protein YvbJ
MKACPFCTAEVPDEARKCKHCGEWIEQPGALANDEASLPSKQDIQVTVRPSKFHIVWAIIVLALILGFFFGFLLPRIQKGERDFERRRQEFNEKWDNEEWDNFGN